MKKLDKIIIEDIIPLTPIQEGMLFHYLKNPRNSIYYEQLSLRISGKIDVGIFNKAWGIVIRTNEMLRVVFRWEEPENPIQIVLKEHQLESGYYDFSGESTREKKKHLEEIKSKDRQTRFDLREVPFRVTWCKLEEDQYEMIIANHHILYDGWSNGIILREFFEAYNHLCSRNKTWESPLKTKFKEFINWSREQDKSKQKEFWTEYLGGFDTRIQFPMKIKKRNGIEGAEDYLLILEGALIDESEIFIKKHGLTLASFFYSAWGILLQRYCGSLDVIFGTTVSGRSTSAKIDGIENIVGLFINTLPLRIKVRAGEKTKDVVHRVNHMLRERESFESTSLVDIKKWSPLTNSGELFDSIMVIENYPLDTRLVLKNKISGLSLRVDSYSSVETTHYDLTISIMTDGDGIGIHFNYPGGLFQKESIIRLSHHFINIIKSILTDLEKDITGIEMLSKEEKKRLLKDFNRTDAAFPRGNTIHQLFVEQVRRIPDNIAVIGNRQEQRQIISITYSELNKRSGQIARALKENDIKPGSIVGLIVEPSVEMIIGVLGILKAGAAYLPIDPEYPEERKKYMLVDSGIKVVVTSGSPAKEASPNIESISIETFEGLNLTASQLLDFSTSHSSRLAYVIYTSGSTGKPKGVMIEHNAVVNLLYGLQEEYPFRETDTYLLKTSYTFDVSVTELFGWILGGGRLSVIGEMDRKDVREILKTIERRFITHINFVPSLFNAFIEILNRENIEKLSTVKYIFLAGEVLSPGFVDKFRRLGSGVFLENIYGPTEAAVYASKYSLDQWKTSDFIPIGTPIQNVKLYIIDRYNRLQPLGLIGELCIGGEGLARGYLNNPELTAQKFRETAAFQLRDLAEKVLSSRVRRKQIIYKSGDLARWLEDGNIEFFGRIDQQIKIRGYRVEPGEIEAHLITHNKITEAAVIARETTGNEKYLCAYIVLKHGEASINHTSELRNFLSCRLPGYMIPSYFVQVEKIPLTPGGKIDRKRLSPPEPGCGNEDDYVPPVSEIEKNLAAMWLEVLTGEEPPADAESRPQKGFKHRKIGIHDNFFDIGGNSLLLIRLASRLNKVLKEKKDISVVTLFNYPTIASLAAHLSGKEKPGDFPGPDLNAVGEGGGRGFDIAVIGMSGRFPGARNIDEFWKNIKNGKDSITFFADEELELQGIDPVLSKNPNYVKAKGILEDMEYFDPQFFDYPVREAQLMDPQMRILHECVWEALENAGYDPFSFKGGIGLYVSCMPNSWWKQQLYTRINTHSDLLAIESLNERDYLATRISYKLNLKGPALTVQTACSSSLTAVDTACQALFSGKCRMALAGGISLTFLDRYGYLYEAGMVRSPEGHCRPFDTRARGTTGGNGVGIVVLKSLSDATADNDNIHAVIKGSATNNDGSRKVSYTAPSVAGQAEVIRAALQVNGINPETITYVETHGTGTALGDPVEIEALTQAFNTAKSEFCALGALKANIGHLDTAAGVAGLIKVVLALEHRTIPPVVNFETPNPRIDLKNSPFFVNITPKKWCRESEDYPLRAGVSSFGIGGTNAHVILEEAPVIDHFPFVSGETKKELDSRLMLLSAKTPAALEQMTENLADYFKKNPHINIKDTAYTLQVGRKSFDCRRMLVCADVNEAIEDLVNKNPGNLQSYRIDETEAGVKAVFMFPGQGAQYMDMGFELYQTEKVFYEEMERCFNILESIIGYNLKEILYPSSVTSVAPAAQKINQTECAQPLIFAFEYALAKLLMTWGIRPYAMIGHSIGEYTAACLSGVFCLEDAIELVVLRGTLMQQMSPGSMLGVPLPEKELAPLLNREIALAAVNSPSDCVVSGAVNSIDTFEKQLEEKGIKTRRLHTSHAFHSRMTEPILNRFKERINPAGLNSPRIPYISNLSGDWITGEEAVDPGYWTRHIRQTVRFADGLKKLSEEGASILIEVGPGRMLSTFARKCANLEARVSPRLITNLIRHPGEEISDRTHLIERIGKLWLYGIAIDWTTFYRGEKRQRISLPAYPFERQQYWIENSLSDSSAAALSSKSSLSPAKKKNIDEWFYTPNWRRTNLSSIGSSKKQSPSAWLMFSGNCSLCHLLAKELLKQGHMVITVKTGTIFSKDSDNSYTINPQQREDYDRLVRDLFSTGRVFQRIVHMWNMTEIDCKPKSIESVDKAQSLGFYSLVYLAAAMGKQDFEHECQVTVITNNMQEVAGEEWLCPEKATLLGPLKVIPLEYSNISCRSIDILLPEPGDWRERKLIDMLQRELGSNITEAVIAYRGNHRLIRTFEPVFLDKPRKCPPRLRKQGVYLITGGLGGIGLTLAKYLVEQVKAKLVLVGRTVLPARQEWEKWLIEYEEENEISRKIRAVQGLEALGGDIFPGNADVSDIMPMQQIISETRKRFGPINGVIHCAGIPGGGMIQLKTKEISEPVLAPRVKGAFILDRLLREEQLDFFILCSSVNSIIAPLGQVDYCAANAFLDAFAHDKAARDGTFCVSINWCAWSEVGMAHRSERKSGQSPDISYQDSILPSEGIDAFNRILENNLLQVVVSNQDFVSQVEQHKYSKFSGLTKPLRKANVSIDAPTPHPRPGLSNSYTAPGNKTEQWLANTMEAFFGFDRIGVHDNFFDLGATSLDLLQLNSILNRELDTEREIGIEKMFTYSTISALAKYLDQRESNQEVYKEEISRNNAVLKGKNRIKRRKTM